MGWRKLAAKETEAVAEEEEKEESLFKADAVNEEEAVVRRNTEDVLFNAVVVGEQSLAPPRVLQ